MKKNGYKSGWQGYQNEDSKLDQVQVGIYACSPIEQGLKLIVLLYYYCCEGIAIKIFKKLT